MTTPEPLTDEELAAIEELADAATPGPWFTRLLDDDQAMNLVAVSTVPDTGRGERWPDFDHHEMVAATLVQHPRYADVADERWDENARFIANARHDIPRLVAEIRRLHRRLATSVPEDGGMLDHLSIQCADMAASAAFYDAVLAPLNGRRILDFGDAIGYGQSAKPTFWIGRRTSGDGFRESHIAFSAPDRASVRAFFEIAAARGAEVLHEPRLWPEYHAGYYGAFVRDPDGNNVEAVCHVAE